MAPSLKLTFIVVTAALILLLPSHSEANPALGKCINLKKNYISFDIKLSDLMGGFDFLGVCIRNCAQCKKMFGSYFEGERCADACVKFKGKIIPDCEDIASIAPFLNKIDA